MTSLEWWRQRPSAPLAALPEFPTFDEAWLWFLAGLAARGEALPPALEAVCVYAEDVRQGRWPDQVPPELALQSVYLALAQEMLVGTGDRRVFEREARRFFEVVAQAVAGGKSPSGDPIVEADPQAQRFVAALRSDRALFAEDLRRARKLEVTLPAEASLTKAPRTVSMLVLDAPASTQFKLWARREGDFALLLVRQRDGVVVLSADPARKLRLGWLAAHLSRRDAAAWYDGARHQGTLVASPKEGTRLDLDAVVSVLSSVARVRRPRRLGPAAAAAAVVVVVALVGVAHLSGRPLPAEAPAAGAKGEPIPAPQVVDLLAAADGPRSFEPYALVAGVCGYQGEHRLEAPCRDARAVRELLTQRLGYRPENVLFFIDRPEPQERVDGPPTAAGLKLAVERFRQRFPAADESSSFLFYYSGHGGYEVGARKDFGVLQPAGYFEDEAAPISARGWEMQGLVDDLRKGVPSRHVMVLLDACYAGWAVGAKGDERLGGELLSLWRERAEVVLSAGTRGQRAWEDEAEPKAWQWGGHSAFTAFLLAGLGGDGAPAADRNGDQVVTDEELARYLRERVPKAVRAARSAEQTPQFFRFDEQLPKSGQFLFLPTGPP